MTRPTLKLVEKPENLSQIQRKTVPCTQEAIDAIPLGSGDWRVEGVPGLYVRCGAASKTFRLQRRVAGKLAVRVLGDMSAAQARRVATKLWQTLKPAPPEGKVTLEQAWQIYVAEKSLAEKTRSIYEDNLSRYLADWKSCTLESLGADRAGFRGRILHIARQHGLAVASQTLRCFRAVYNYQRQVNPDLPECPAIAVKLPAIKPRDWALSDEKLHEWWQAVERLTPLKRTFWLVMLLTGARRGSVEALRWEDVDFQRRSIHFATARAGRTYTIPASQRLLDLLAAWRQECLPTDAGWVFPSPQKPGEHIVTARDDKRGVASAHHLRHTYRTVLVELGATPDQARLLLGHSLGGDVSRGYITPHLVVESLRPLAEAVAAHYARVLGWDEQQDEGPHE